jgi:hypothetical protein
MPGVLYQYLSGDHDRLGTLLERAVAKPVVIDMEPTPSFERVCSDIFQWRRKSYYRQSQSGKASRRPL